MQTNASVIVSFFFISGWPSLRRIMKKKMFTFDLDFYTLAIAVVFSNFVRELLEIYIYSLLSSYFPWLFCACIDMGSETDLNASPHRQRERKREAQSHFMYGKHLVKFPQSLEKCRTDYVRGERRQKIIFIIISTRAIALHAFDATSNRIIHLWFYGKLIHTLHSTNTHTHTIAHRARITYIFGTSSTRFNSAEVCYSTPSE